MNDGFMPTDEFHDNADSLLDMYNDADTSEETRQHCKQSFAELCTYYNEQFNVVLVPQDDVVRASRMHRPFDQGRD